MSRGRSVNFDEPQLGDYLAGPVLLTFPLCIVPGLWLLAVMLLDVLSGYERVEFEFWPCVIATILISPIYICPVLAYIKDIRSLEHKGS